MAEFNSYAVERQRDSSRDDVLNDKTQNGIIPDDCLAASVLYVNVRHESVTMRDDALEFQLFDELLCDTAIFHSSLNLWGPDQLSPGHRSDERFDVSSMARRTITKRLCWKRLGICLHV